jgi:hypothetical protein
MAEDKQIKYVNKTFSDFKQSLQEFTKIYFPDNYNDFSEASPGSMFIEMASYIGDVSSFYIDSQVQENFLNLAKEKESLYNLAYSFGYRPKVSYASSTTLDIYQLLQSINGSPNLLYSLLIPENTIISSNLNNQKFLTLSPVDFSDTSSADISYVNDNNFLIKKSVDVISADIKTDTFSFTSPKKFDSITINDTNILQVLEVKDSDNNLWYEVPYLAQDLIPLPTINATSGSDNINYLLNFQRVSRRFVTRVKPNDKLEIQFGAGIANTNNTDTTILPTPHNINLGLIPSISTNIDNYNKASIFYTKAYGLVPQNTTLTVKYLVGGGLSSNIPANSLTTIDNTNITFKYGTPISGGNEILNSIACNNESSSLGGRGADTIEEVRLNALNAYSSQNRTVTKEDYIMRALSMPSKYGTVSKAYLTQETYNSSGTLLNNNPLSLDLYVLGYNSDKTLKNANLTLKNNLKNYLNQYRMITDAINIKNAFYINLGVNFEINSDPSYNNKELLSNCISVVKTYFDIDSWQINQPIILAEINALLLKVPGVRSVPKVEIINKQGGNYSPYGYDIIAATRNGILYPSIDPSIFEIRFPNIDINGRVITY